MIEEKLSLVVPGETDYLLFEDLAEPNMHLTTFFLVGK